MLKKIFVVLVIMIRVDVYKRQGLYKEDSDVDVVIAYEGTVREDDLFSALNEAGHKVGNMRVDMNPVSYTHLDVYKTGTGTF